MTNGGDDDDDDDDGSECLPLRSLSITRAETLCEAKLIRTGLGAHIHKEMGFRRRRL
jgi:hypothetical protein